MSDPIFVSLTRSQFSYIVGTKKSVEIIEQVAAKHINILAIAIENDVCGKVSVALIVGLTKTTEKDDEWNAEVRAILKKFCVCYEVRKVAQAITVSDISNTPGVFIRIYAPISKNTEIYRVYQDAIGGYMFETSNLAKTLEIINSV